MMYLMALFCQNGSAWSIVGDLLSGDPSYDGLVGSADLDIIRANWGQGTPPTPTAVPEPGMLVLLVTACAGLLAACWKR